ncbi:MAG: SAM-dependent methyltransferase [Halobacteriota archaeon]
MSSEEVVDRVNEYYDECQVDYAMMWGTNHHLSMHYGYHDDENRRLGDAVVNLNRVDADRADVGAGDRVLDAGCGVGGSAIWLASERDAEVVGVNINANQIEKARRGAARHGVESRTEFHVADYVDTGLEDDSFDVVWLVESACHAEDKTELLREMYRVLRPGGRIVVADGLLGRRDLSESEREGVDAMLEGMAAPNLTTVAEFREALYDVGFEDVEFEDRFDSVLPSARRIYLMTVLTFPVALMLRLLRIRSETQWLHLKAAYHQYPMLKNGAWVHGLFRAVKPE